MAKVNRPPDYYHHALFEVQGSEFGITGHPPGDLDNYTGYAGVHYNRRTDTYGACSDFICSRLGAILGLPIPPCIAAIDSNDEHWFGSLDFAYARERLPRIVPEKVIEYLSDIASGILVFDIWIANEDRNDGNLAVDLLSSSKSIHIFDHEKSLLSGSQKNGCERLKEIAKSNALGCDKQGVASSGCRHIFLDLVSKADEINSWVRKVGLFPDSLIQAICDSAMREMLLSGNDSVGAFTFLQSRKANLPGIIKANRSQFTGITKWPEEGLFNEQG